MSKLRTYHSPRTLAFWKAYGIHMRPYLLFVSGVAGWAGMAVGGSLADRPWRSVVGLVAFFLAYGFGQALTDCFQVDTDRISAAYRPLSRQTVSRGAVAVVSIVGLLAVGAVLLALNPWNLPFVVLSITGLATYSYVKRHCWYAGPFYNAWIVMLLPAMGYLSITGESPGPIFISGPLVPLLLLSFFSYANFVLMGYLKDVTADRKTGYVTFPVRWGYEPTIRAGDLLALLSILPCAVVVADGRAGIPFLVFGSVVALAGQGFAHRTGDRTEENMAFPIAATVRSFLLWHMAVITAQRPGVWLWCTACYLAFELVLSLRPDEAQI